MKVRSITKGLLIASASAMALLAATPVLAEDKGTEVDEVVVTGIRASLQASLIQKRKSDQIEEVITAEDIGKFPDKNVADSLGRAPGVNVVTGSASAGGFGENERVSIRGTDPSLNLTLLDGHGVATGDWFVLDQTAGGRSFNYSMLPSEVVGRMEVLKSAQADTPEGGVGGTVNVHTRMPLDLPSMTINGSLQGAYASRADKWSPQASGMISWKNDEGTFGILAGAFYEKREFRRDGQEFLGYSAQANFAGTGQTVIYPNLIGYAYFTQERIRKGGDITVQWKPNDRVELSLSGLYTRMDADNTNRNSMIWLSNLVPANTTPGNDYALASYTITNGYLTAASFNNTTTNGTPVKGKIQDDIFRTAHSDSWFINLDGRFEISDTLTFTGQIGYAKGEGATDDTEAYETYWQTGASYSFNGPTATISYPGLPADTTSAAYLNNFYSWSWGGQVTAPDEETYASGDFDWRIDNGFFKSVKFGARYTDHQHDLIYNAYSWAGNGLYSGTSTIDLGTAYAGGMTPSNYFSGLGGGNVGYTFSDRAKVLALLATQGGRHFAFYPPLSFAVGEKTLGFYGMARFGGDTWRGNVGVRAIRTQQETTQYSGVITPFTIHNQFGDFSEQKVSREYWDVLPSLNLTFEASDDLLIRFGAAKVMTRPGYAQLAGAFSLNDTAKTGTVGGNPNLDPFRAWQFSASAEWYYNKDSLLSVGVFYLDIDSYITTSAPFVVHLNTQQHPAPGADFTLTQPVNGSGGTNRGFEISWQQPLGGGFGVIANYTYADAKTDMGDAIDGSSKNTYNLTGYFENEWLSARLAYNYRSKFKSGTDRSTPMWQDDISSLDASVNVTVTPHINLTFDAQNLTDEKLVYFVGDKSIPRAIYDNGRTFYAGIRFKF